MYSKVVVFFAVAALVGANDIFETANHTGGEKRVFEAHFKVQWAITRQVKDVFVNSSDIITRINVTDLREGKDGEAHVVSGGVGHENVTISLKSPAVFRGFDFLIEVFSAGAEQIDRGQRGVQVTEPAEIPQGPKTEDKIQTIVPADVTTAKPRVSTTGKPTVVTGAPDAPSKPDVTGLPIGTGVPDAAGLPTVTPKPGAGVTASPAEKVAPKQEMEGPEEIEQEPKVQAFVGFQRPLTSRPTQHH